MSFGFGVKELKAGKYKVIVTKTINITIHTDYKVDEGLLAVEAISLGDLQEFKIEKQ